MVGESKSPGISPYELKQLFENVLKGSDGKTLSDLYDKLLDLESRLTNVESQVLKLQFDVNNFLRVGVANFEVMSPTEVQSHWNEAVTLLSSGTRSADGSGTDVKVGKFVSAEITIDVTDVAGTFATGEGLTVYIEGKDEISGKYHTLWSNSTPYTAPTTERVHLDIFSNPSLAFRLVRVRWTITGTNPSFTFGVYMQGKS